MFAQRAISLFLPRVLVSINNKHTVGCQIIRDSKKSWDTGRSSLKINEKTLISTFINIQ